MTRGEIKSAINVANKKTIIVIILFSEGDTSLTNFHHLRDKFVVSKPSKSTCFWDNFAISSVQVLSETHPA